MSKQNNKNESNLYIQPTCFGECRGCLVAHCIHAKECLDFQKERETQEHEAECHDMQMAAMGDERYL